MPLIVPKNSFARACIHSVEKLQCAADFLIEYQIVRKAETFPYKAVYEIVHWVG